MLEFFQEAYTYFANNQLELWATIFGIICVYLNAVENIWAWPTGLISVAGYVYIFWNANLYGDFGLHIIYVILGVYGWYNWLYGGKQHDVLKITASSQKELLMLLMISSSVARCSVS